MSVMSPGKQTVALTGTTATQQILSRFKGLSQPLKLSSATAFHSFPSIAVTGDAEIWAVWRQGASHDIDDDGKLNVAKSTDGGATFSAEATLYDPAGRDPRDPNIVINPHYDIIGILHHQADEARGSSYPTVYNYRSGNGGSSFSLMSTTVFDSTGQLGTRTNVAPAFGPAAYMTSVYGRDGGTTAADTAVLWARMDYSLGAPTVDTENPIAAPGFYVNETALWFDRDHVLHAMIRADGRANLHYTSTNPRDDGTYPTTWTEQDPFPWELHAPQVIAVQDMHLLCGRKMSRTSGGTGLYWGNWVYASIDGGNTWVELFNIPDQGDAYVSMCNYKDEAVLFVYPMQITTSNQWIFFRKLTLR